MGTIVEFQEEIEIVEGFAESQRFHFANYITPFLSHYYYTLCTPYKIEFDTKSGLYVCKQGSFLHKIAAMLWLSFHILYIIWGIALSPILRSVASDSDKLLHVLAYLLYAVYEAFWLDLMWRKLRKIPSILNLGNQIYRKLKSENEFKTSSYRLINLAMPVVLCISSGCTFVWATSSVTTTLRNIQKDMQNAGYITPTESFTLILETNHSTPAGSFSRIDDFVNATLLSFCQIQSFWCSILETEQYRFISYSVALFWIFIMFITETYWQINMYMMTLWALYFRRLVVLGTKKIKMAVTHEELLSASKLFLKIGLTMDSFNGIFGLLIVSATLDTILYKTICFATVLGGEFGGVIGSIHLYLVSSIVPSCTMLYFMAVVHKLGCAVPNILRRKLLIGENFSFDEALSLGGVQRSILIQNDMLTNTIGFSGAGFFTISFRFVASIVGVIITYTIVMIQFTSGAARRMLLPG